MPIIQSLLGGLTEGGGSSPELSPWVPDTAIPDGYDPSGWKILMNTFDKKIDSGAWNSSENNVNRNNFGNTGNSNFRNANLVNNGAINRTSFGDGTGLYLDFFLKTGVTKLAIVDGTSENLDPTQHTNYLIYDLVESSGSESIYEILRRLDHYQQYAPEFQGNDSVWGNPSVLNHTAGINGYSGLLSSQGGVDFLTNDSQTPDKICIMGINQDSDNDIQALCAFSGNLNSGKGDSWRGDNPAQTFWSYWGHDFHSNSREQRIGFSLQTTPGVASGAGWAGAVYLLAF